MLQRNFVNFKQQRDLGSILTDTFKFIRLEWKQLFTLVLKIAGPALLAVIAAYVFYMSTTLGSFGQLGTGPNPFGDFTFNTILSVILLLIATMVFYSLLYGTVLHYIKSYVQNNGMVDTNEVMAGVKAKFLSLTGLNFLVGMIVVVGFLLCILPGFYFGTVLFSAYAIHVFDNKSATDSISYSFELIKNEFWITLATILVVVMLYYFILMIFNVPQYIYFFIKMFTFAEQSSPDPAEMFDWVYIALTAFASLCQHILHTILVICGALIYFNLNERKNFTGTLETIDRLGNSQE